MVEGEALVHLQGLVAQQQPGDAFVGIAQLVNVHGDGGYAAHAEIVVGDVVAELSGEGEDETAVAGVDVAPEPVLLGQGADVGYGVVDAVGVGGRGAGDHDGVGVDCVGHGVDVRTVVDAGRDPDGLDAEDVGGLVEGGVGGPGHDYLGGGGGRPVVSSPGLGRLHGNYDALGAAGGDAAPGALGGG